MPPVQECCKAWNKNTLIASTLYIRAVLDAHPVTDGHALIYPRRHVDSITDLLPFELYDLFHIIRYIQKESDTKDFTIGINEGPLAGQTIPHLHIHIIPRRKGDVPNPTGGIRRLLIPDITQDPYLKEL